MRMSLTKVLAAVVLAVIVLLAIVQFGPSVLAGARRRSPMPDIQGRPRFRAVEA